MKKLLIILGAIIVIIAGTFVILGLSLPSEREFIQVTEIDAPADVVWRVLSEREKFPEWQDQLEGVEVVNEKEWIEHTKSGGDLEFRIKSETDGRSMEIEYSMGDSFKGTWSGELSPRGDSSTLLRTTDRTMVDGWLTKVMISFFFDIEDFAKDWNQKLKKRCESIAGKGE